ncbi:MAG: glycosyltransferase family 39 protein [Candidatus Hydrogenedentes bacterium]|nr:glycosyltransferase family 39 protein [Candidatus Hydrogenedentota bacterium]
MIPLLPTWLVLGSAYIVGTWLLRPVRVLRLRADFEGHAYRVLAGLTLVALLILCAGSIAMPIALYALLAIFFSGTFLYWPETRSARQLPGFRRHRVHEPFDLIEIMSLAVAGTALLLVFVASLAPVTGWDACVAHLALPAAYVRNGRIMLVEGNNYSGYPQLMHVLFAFALDHGTERAAAALNWTFAALACAMAYFMGKRLDSRRAGCVAAAAVATAPVLLDQGSAPSVDMAFVTLTLGALNAFVAWKQEHRRAWIILAAMLAGAACGVRQTAYLVAVLLAVMVFVFTPAHRLRHTSLFVFVCGVAALPWLMRSAIVTGNPFFPFFTSWFPTPDLPDVDAALVGTHESVRGVSILDLLLFPWNIVFHPDRYGGWGTSPGGLVLILGIPGLLVGGKHARRIGAFCGAGVVCMYFFRRLTRYLFPFLAPMLVLSGVGASRLKSLRPLIVVVLIISYAIGLVPAAGAVAIKAPAIFGFESREDYLTRRVERYPAFRWVNETLESSSTILTLDPRGYFFQVPCFENFEALKELVGMPVEFQIEWLRAHDIKYVFYPEAYVLESPGFHETGVLDVVQGWREDPEHFTLVKRLELDRPRIGGKEIVEVYEVNFGA